MKLCKICKSPIGGFGFKCHYCSGFYCIDHRIPENHNCTGNPPNLNLNRDKLYNKPEIIDDLIENMLNNDEESNSKSRKNYIPKFPDQNKQLEQLIQDFGVEYHFKCKICKNPVSLFYLICFNCSQLYCTHCGHFNIEFPSRCPNCGKKVDDLFNPAALKPTINFKEMNDLKIWVEKTQNTTIIECEQCSSKYFSKWKSCPYCGKKIEIIDDIIDNDDDEESIIFDESIFLFNQSIIKNLDNGYKLVLEDFGNHFNFLCKICKKRVSLYSLTCSYCGHFYCPNCGHILENPTKCSHCGAGSYDFYGLKSIENVFCVKDKNELKNGLEKAFDSKIVVCNTCSSKFFSKWKSCPYCGKKI